MVVYNRRKRALYFQEQEHYQAQVLQLARDAVHAGTATPAQKALVEGIAEEEALWEKKKAERKAPSKLLWWLHGDWNEEKELKEQRRLALEEFAKNEAAGNLNPQERSVTEAVRQAVQETRASAGVAAEAAVVGGPLDQAAAQATEKVSKGWLSWVPFGSKKSE
jgi:hypothetical protein